ncbi:glycosyltransferase family A protein [Pedobacter sp. MC2016-15]|uniref:glycosyltransferase family A protein n=1 Tax=Pedobacter sp. MC2016-15 TaxID=2994473 RepID=UPI0022459BB1|nr:glycosyltransferase family A protein [Pedobacter sp. MC2016-15]MCX2480970.1 glycosyltransferase family A protein [Pedobacter sp. MC2016-15]
MRLLSDYSLYHVILWNKQGPRNHYDMLFFSFEFLNEKFDYILVLKFDFPTDLRDPDIAALIKALEKIYDKEENTFVILTYRQELPLYKEGPGEFIYSFSCSFENFKRLIAGYHNSAFLKKNLLYEILDNLIIHRLIFTKILVRQIPIIETELSFSIQPDVIIPHRGSNLYLRNLLFYMDHINGINVHIGIDQLMPGDSSKMSRKFPLFNFYSIEPNPVGPYVIRNWLIDHSESDIIFFQDSDDLPTSDRFAMLTDYIYKYQCQLCGSHEISVDSFNRTVRAVRFPADVKAALDYGPGHCLLHPASAILRSSFYHCGKLSEERRFGNDTKFLYNSYFILNTMKNIDEFLYIRRKRPNSLTTTPGIMIGSEARLALIRQWIEDFALIKQGSLKLENSSLVFTPTPYRFRVKKSISN